MHSRRTTVIYLYGPPAVGKTTVALAVSRKTGYPVLHPHLFSPIAGAFMHGDMRTNREFRKLMTTLRLESLRAALRANTPGVVVTGVYVYKTKRNRFIEMLKRLPARVHFVRLTALETSLMRRVTAKSRKRFDQHKIITREKLRERMTSENVTSAIHGIRSLTVDTDAMRPTAAAEHIIRRLKLQIN